MPSRGRCVVWLAVALIMGCREGAEPRRSVLLITIDTLRADALGSYGSENGASSHLDDLAERGVLFEQAHASSPNTLPSHASILTGLQPFHHRVRENGANKLAESHVTIATRLREAGYYTGAEVAAAVLARGTGIAQGFEHFRDIESPGVELQQIRVASDGSLDDPSAAPDDENAKTAPLGTRGAADITRAGVTFLRARYDSPFFLWLHYYDPHWPYAPPAPFAERFARDRYAGEVATVDESIGQLTLELERLGLEDRTLLIVTADHGEGMGDHGESRHSYLVYQETMRVPLLFVGPGVPAGRRVPSPVQTIDISPTILAWLGLAPDPATDGVSLLPAFEGDALPESLVYGESVALRRILKVSPLRFVREGPWKLIHKPIPELYDLVADPAESSNRAQAEAARVERLRGRLQQLLASRREAPGDAQAELDAKTREQLQSLGYVVGESSASDEESVDSIEVHGPDPKQLMAKLDPFVDALTATQFSDAKHRAQLLQRLSREFPESTALLDLLIDAELAAGFTEQALASLRRGIELEPEKERYWNNLGELLAGLGRDDEAAPVLKETLKRSPCDLASRTRLTHVLSRTGKRAEVIAVLEQGVQACDSPPELMNDLAYQLATARADELRDGKRALALAEAMIGKLGDNPLALDTLAVAQAEAGRRDDARSTLARAIALAEQQKLPEEGLRVLREHAAQLEAGHRIRE